MTTELAIRNADAPLPMTLSETLTLGDVLAKSGFFKDARSAAQAVAKILAGRELGFGPMASMTGIHIIEGKPTVSATLMAAAVKGAGKYDYRVRESSDTACEIEFFQHGESIGKSKFTIQDATKANVAGKATWKQYPKNMLFARAMSNGVRFYCADILGGNVVYTPEELDVDVTAEGDIADITAISVEAETVPERPAPPPQQQRRQPAASVAPEAVAQRTQPPGRQRIDGIVVAVGGTANDPTVTIEKQGKRLTFHFTEAVSPDHIPTADELGQELRGIVVKDGETNEYVITEVSFLGTPADEAGEQPALDMGA